MRRTDARIGLQMKPGDASRDERARKRLEGDPAISRWNTFQLSAPYGGSSRSEAMILRNPRRGSCLGAMPVETSSAVLKPFDLLALERLKENSARLCRLARGEAYNSLCSMDETVPARDDIRVLGCRRVFQRYAAAGASRGWKVAEMKDTEQSIRRAHEQVRRRLSPRGPSKSLY